MIQKTRMKIKIVITIICISTLSYSQSFKKDWVDFSSKNWIMELNADNNSAPNLGKKSKGRLIFKNTENTSIQIIYYIYNSSNRDSIFQKKVMDWYAVQSCSTFSDEKTNFTAFDYKEFYYLLHPCHNCNIDNTKDCENLSKQLISKTLNKKYTLQGIKMN